MIRRLSVLVAAFVTASACGPGAVPQNAAQAPVLPGGECKAANPSLRPLVVEWPSPDRLALEAQATRGTVVVHYAGCKLDVLRQCKAPGTYRFGAATRQDDHVAIHNTDELRASLPAYAMQLEGKLQRAGKLDVDMALVGAWVSEVADVHASVLEGDCAGATHVVSALTVGAFEFGTKADAQVAASVSAGGAGAGGKSGSMTEVLSRAGDRKACDTATMDAKHPPPGCGAVVRLDLRPLSGLSGAGPTRCRVELGPAKCPRNPAVTVQTFDDSYEHSDVDPERCAKRAAEYFSYCGSGEPVTTRFFKNGKEDRVTTFDSPTRCVVNLRDCPRTPSAAGHPFNDDYESSRVDQVRCLQRADEYWNHCGTGEPVTVQFMRGSTVVAEKTSSFASRCQLSMPECPRTSEMSNVVFNDTFEAADKDPARCARRAAEFVSWCGAGQGATARFIRGTTVEREEKVPASTTHCQLTLPDCPRSPAMAGPFNDSFEHADTDEGRCLRRADDWRNHCGTGAAVTARFFRGATKSAERTATSATRCQVTVDACPTHTDYVAVFNDPFDGSDTSADRCAKRAPEFVTWCGGGKATARFYRGANLEREQRAP